MKNIHFILILFVVLLTSCQKKEVTIIKNISFNTGFIDPHFRFIGKVNQSDSTQIYIMDKELGEIKLFSISGELIKSIDVTEAIDFLRTKQDLISNIEIYSLDSILICSNYYNYLLLLNREGEIIENKNIEEYVDSSYKGYKQYNFSYYPNANSDLNNLYLFVSNTQKINNDYSIPMFTYESMYNYFLQYQTTPALINIKSFFTKDPSYSFILPNYYAMIDTVPHFINYNCYKVFDDKIILLVSDKGEIIVVDKDNPDDYKIIRIESEVIDSKGVHTRIPNGYKEADSDYFKTMDIYDMKKRKEWSIQNVFEANDKKSWYVLVGHRPQENEGPKGFQYRGFTLVKYSHNFKKIREYHFEPNIYDYRTMIMTPEGLMIRRKDNDITIDNYGTQTFDLLDLN